jgi:hypothetical protein
MSRGAPFIRVVCVRSHDVLYKTSRDILYTLRPRGPRQLGWGCPIQSRSLRLSGVTKLLAIPHHRFVHHRAPYRVRLHLCHPVSNVITTNICIYPPPLLSATDAVGNRPGLAQLRKCGDGKCGGEMRGQTGRSPAFLPAHWCEQTGKRPVCPRFFPVFPEQLIKDFG